MEDNITIRLGDFEVIALDRENYFNPQKIHMAFVRYNGMIPLINQPFLVFEIGAYDGSEEIQKGSLFYFPASKKIVNFRVDTYGRRVKLEIMQASPLEVKVKDLTERQTAING